MKEKEELLQRQYFDLEEIRQEFLKYVLRTCIHVGEVSLSGVNPISLAIFQTFKMEKAIKANQIGLTETAYNIAWPTISRAYKGFTEIGDVELDGYKKSVKLYELILHDADDLSRIVEENLNSD